jgi:hypothetical protein
MAAWSRVLERFVDDDGRVAFKQLAQDRADLAEFVEFVAKYAPHTRAEWFPTRAAKIAFHLNAYNAMAMHAVLEGGIAESLGGLNKYWFVGVTSHRIAGQDLILHRYETDFIRTLGEPRIHFVLNCMSVGCPRLPRTPINAARLEHDLDQATRFFLTDARNVRVDHSARSVWLSEIFDFFPEDFLQSSPSIVAYVNRYRAEQIPDNYAVQFIDYDWTVNAQ